MESKLKTSLTADQLKDKIKGIIFGTAIGDGIGLATEFMRREQAQVLYGNGPIKFGNGKGHEIWRDAHRNRWHENDFTDDTDQMLLILQCLLADNGTLNPVHFAYRVKEWTRIGFPELSNKVPNGIGFTVGSTCSHPDMLTDPLGASYDIWNSNKRNLAANGAVMRTGVVGAPFFWDESKVVENAMMQAKVTHTDPRSVTSAVIVSVLISRLLRGTAPAQDCSADDRKLFTDMIVLGSDKDRNYLERFSHFPAPSVKSLNSPIRNQVVRQFRRFTAFVTSRPLNPIFEADFKFPEHSDLDVNRYQHPAAIRPNVKRMDEFGADKNMLELCRNVVEKYKFLVEDNSLCPSYHQGDDESAKQLESEPKWVDQLHQHCFPDSLSALKLDERSKIGYTFKCLGAALYLGTRRKPEGMTCAQFFEHLITELLLETGDADTNCAVAGAVLGARLGKSGLPKEWVQGLRHYHFLHQLSDDLCAMVIKNMQQSDTQTTETKSK